MSVANLMFKRKSAGFTLIELMVVIAIISLLASAVMVALKDVRKKARDTRRQADVKAINEALAMYTLDNAGALPNRSTNGDIYNFTRDLVPKYLPKLPKDPAMDRASRYTGYYYCMSDPVNGPGGNRYRSIVVAYYNENKKRWCYLPGTLLPTEGGCGFNSNRNTYNVNRQTAYPPEECK